MYNYATYAVQVCTGMLASAQHEEVHPPTIHYDIVTFPIHGNVGWIASLAIVYVHGYPYTFTVPWSAKQRYILLPQTVWFWVFHLLLVDDNMSRCRASIIRLACIYIAWLPFGFTNEKYNEIRASSTHAKNRTGTLESSNMQIHCIPILINWQMFRDITTKMIDRWKTPIRLSHAQLQSIPLVK